MFRRPIFRWCRKCFNSKRIEKIKPEEGDSAPISQDACFGKKMDPGKPGRKFDWKTGRKLMPPKEEFVKEFGDVNLSPRIAKGVLNEESNHEGRQQK